MKTLPSITVGKYEVVPNVEYIGGAVVEVSVHCLDQVLAGRMAHLGTHAHSEEQFEKDVNDFAQRLALELAGTLRSKELAEKFARG